MLDKIKEFITGIIEKIKDWLDDLLGRI